MRRAVPGLEQLIDPLSHQRSNRSSRRNQIVARSPLAHALQRTSRVQTCVAASQPQRSLLRIPIMYQTAVGPSRLPVSHHLDHLELLLLDSAVVRVAEHYVETHALSASQRGALQEYRTDLDALVETLEGPSRDYAEHVLSLARTILDSEAEQNRTPRTKAHWAA